MNFFNVVKNFVLLMVDIIYLLFLIFCGYDVYSYTQSLVCVCLYYVFVYFVEFLYVIKICEVDIDNVKINVQEYFNLHVRKKIDKYMYTHIIPFHVGTLMIVDMIIKGIILLCN